MIILGEDAQVEGRFDLFGDSANLDARCNTPVLWLHQACAWHEHHHLLKAYHDHHLS